MFLKQKKDSVCAAMPIRRAAMPIRRAAMPIRRAAMPICARSYADKARSYADGVNDLNLACSRRYLPQLVSFLFYFSVCERRFSPNKRAAMPI
jgi:hypothetical protein